MAEGDRRCRSSDSDHPAANGGWESIRRRYYQPHSLPRDTGQASTPPRRSQNPTRPSHVLPLSTLRTHHRKRDGRISWWRLECSYHETCTRAKVHNNSQMKTKMQLLHSCVSVPTLWRPVYCTTGDMATKYGPREA